MIDYSLDSLYLEVSNISDSDVQGFLKRIKKYVDLTKILEDPKQDYSCRLDKFSLTLEKMQKDNESAQGRIVKYVDQLRGKNFEKYLKEKEFKNCVREFKAITNKVVEEEFKLSDGDSRIMKYYAQMVKKRCNKRVFLSYAYEDKLYTLFLFLCFSKYNIYMYVDWMSNTKAEDGNELQGIKLKEKLCSALNVSEDIIFLKSTNSEILLHDKNYVRPWCAWELGIFYSLNKDKKNNRYYVDLSQDNEEDMMLAGLKKLENDYL